jgi:hypothetical protein
MGKQKIHRNCGGVIKNHVCTKCKMKFGKLRRFFFTDSDDVEEPFNEREHRRRVREGRDIRGEQ